MRLRTQQSRRLGAIIPMVAISLVALFAFLALAIDLGMLLVARTQAQNVVDAASMAGARTLDGTPSHNKGNAILNAKAVAQLNVVLGQGVQLNDSDILIGSYQYQKDLQLFLPEFPTPKGSNANLMQVSCAPQRPSAFARIVNMDFLSVYATAMAAHRPRDTCLVLDYSGSMNDESDLWNAVFYLNPPFSQGGTNDTSNNLDPTFPQFGHYSVWQQMQNFLLTPPTASTGQIDARIGKSNVTFSPQSLGTNFPVIAATDFYRQPFGQGSKLAFNPVNAPKLYVAPAGDQYQPVAGTSTTPPTFATTVQDVNGSATTQWAGYQNFQGFTRGPGYWGQTFFIWPPDPRQANDWRQKFFLNPGGTYPNFGGPVTDNTKLWQSSGQWNDPTGNYVINYKAILNWIKTECIQKNPNDGRPFPPELHGGQILYYDAVPDHLPKDAYDPTIRNSDIKWTDPNQRFWKEYIDFTLGVWLPPSGGVQHPQSTPCSYGPDFTWNKVHISAPPQGPTGEVGEINNAGGYLKDYQKALKVNLTGSAPQVGQLVQFQDPTQQGKKKPPPPSPLYTITKVNGTSSITLDRALTSNVADQAKVTLFNPYMNYLDNPRRPRHRMWFGPMTMIQFLLNYGQMPGTANDISMATAKHGVQAALVDIQNNHPNDLVSLILFNRPPLKGDPPGLGSFAAAQVELTNNYQSLINLMYYPPGPGPNPGGETRLFADPTTDPGWTRSPRAAGDYWVDTTTNYGLMLAYNQFSGQSYASGVGGGGRTGASRLVILETDGMANIGAQAGFHNQKAQSATAPNNSYYEIGPADTVSGSTASPGQDAINVAITLCAKTTDPVPGFSTASKPVKIYCIAFGAIFENPCPEQSVALPFLAQISTTGSTGGNVITVIGSQQQREQNMATAFVNIMDADVPVSLIK
jgi:hypothetical protein